MRTKQLTDQIGFQISSTQNCKNYYRECREHNIHLTQLLYHVFRGQLETYSSTIIYK